MIAQIRYEQQYQQLQNAPKQGVGSVMTYAGRDPTTGARIVRDATGSQQPAQYLSNSEPGGVLALSQPALFGLTGYISQKVR
jgi:hypothetical protein